MNVDDVFKVHKHAKCISFDRWLPAKEIVEGGYYKIKNVAGWLSHAPVLRQIIISNGLVLKDFGHAVRISKVANGIGVKCIIDELFRCSNIEDITYYEIITPDDLKYCEQLFRENGQMCGVDGYE